MENYLNRDYCLSLLKEYTQSDSLLKHAFAVESCVKAYARKFGEDENFWGNVALLHDFDYEKYPTAEDHPFKGAEILRAKNFPEDFIQSILSHADYTGVKRETLLQKTLFACDELAGFLTAVAYVRPSKSIDEVEVKSVKKKMKDKAFARAVSREDILKGAEELGIDLDTHIAFCIEAMKQNKGLLGL
ncbi:Putative hydrolase [Ignavibacterium album JCM 16511]|uniref:Putative hydrolase n=1 Tax=Ignavibacterium album (strain DSM 19864 / JCM 16511 / NBRC 101810 / Mat9-16) TaxID=945713 RepID=I0AJC1_IGNAJ|nr:HDIG domain-containing metalloprotein [Ignavibacterium album]AFH49078.1 Putative hydrolase [Ignavibacterium album JCM 16511]